MSQGLLPVSDSVAARLDGRPLAVMLDVDGTLAPIAPRPEEAAVPAETRRVVAALAVHPDVRVVLVSGRAAADARRIVGVANVWVIGNHGFEVVSPDGEELEQPELEPWRAAVARAARRIAPLVAPVPGVILEDKGWTLSVHYRLADPKVVPRLVESVERAAAPLGLRVSRGKMVVEVRPDVRVDKGTAVLRLAAELGAISRRDGAGVAEDADGGTANGGTGSALFIGDDRTDEDAFRALRSRSARAVTVRVTHGDEVATAAEFLVEDPAAVRVFLEWLLERSR
ncbi:MAG TPA: trehalose-phosphatase [Gemmatimonadaceae bacterium]|nr:trehalose-phosphatase [Gemmatimonadaceae bacterium]